MPRNPADDVGAIIAMKVGRSRYGYGRIGDNVAMQVFDVLTTGGLLSPEAAVKYPVAFWTIFLNDGFKDGRWKKIGHVPFEKTRRFIRASVFHR